MVTAVCVVGVINAALAAKPKTVHYIRSTVFGWRRVMAVDLDDMTDQELMGVVEDTLERLAPAHLSRVIELVQAKRQAKEEEIKQALLAEFREKAAQMGLPFESIFPGRRTRSDAGSALTPKYRGPLGETWSGRGRMPTWLTHLEAAGHKKEEFRVKEESSS